jgi:DNA repair photolyase
MKAVVSLPLAAPNNPPFLRHSSDEVAAPALPRVERVERQGALLHPGPFGSHADVLCLNLAQGCAHRCAFCSARAYPTYPGDDMVRLFADTPERLAKELSNRSRRPRAVYISPSTDPFMPLAEVQAETSRVVEVLAEHDVEAWLMTRGFIRPAALDVLTMHRDRVRVTVGVTTLDRRIRQQLEPLAAPPRMRLRQIVQMRERDVPIQVEVAPLVPGVTDTRESLAALLEALAFAGVRHVTAGYLFLRPGIQANLARVLGPLGLEEMVLQEFANGPVLHADGLAPARYLPKVRRQRGYAALKAMAAGLGITVSVCGLTNPDFRSPQARAETPPRQRLLPRF